VRQWLITVGMILSILLTFPFDLQAQSSFDGIVIQADSGERDLNNRSMELKGNVQILFKSQHLSADRAIIYQDRKEFEAQGHVLLVTPKATLGGDKIIMNYETNIGTVYSGFIQSGQLIFEGAIIEKTGDDQYLTLQSQYTSCTTCPAAWSFSGQSIEAQIGGYALIKNSLLHFGNVPVLWLPYLIVPLKSERQTGLLAPSFEYSEKSGLSVELPFFWAISKNQDATFTLHNYATRGLKGLANYRYILTRESSGELDGAFLRDGYFGQTNRHKTYLGSADRVNRWFLRYKHYWVLPEDWIQRIDVNNASDLQYPTDFPFETLNYGDPAMENRISLTKNTEDRHFSIDNSYYINMLKSHPMGDNRDSVHRLPEISLVSTRKPIGETGLLYNYDLRYTNFARNDFAYDDLVEGIDADGKTSRQAAHECTSGGGSANDPNWEKDPNCRPKRDGEFTPGTDLIRSGQRLILEPSVSRPTRLGTSFNLVPKISFRESHYSFGIQDAPELTRRFLRSEIKLQTSFSRIFGDQEKPFGDRYKHEIQPEVISTAVPWLDQPDHPFLGFANSSEVPFYSREAASDSDLFGDHGIQFDYDDRLYDRNLITYRITNKVTRKSWNANNTAASYDRLMTWRVSQTYDAYEAQQPNNRQPWSDIESILSIRLAHFNTYTKINFLPYQKLSDTSSQLTFNDDNGNYLSLGLTRKYLPESDGSIDVSKRIEDYLVQIGTTAKYVNFAGRLIYNGNDDQAALDKTRLKALTYAIIVRPPGNCWGIHFLRHQSVAQEDDVTYKLHFDFLFDGKASPISPTKLLERYGF
jgi:LPS-assembly protein